MSTALGSKLCSLKTIRTLSRQLFAKTKPCVAPRYFSIPIKRHDDNFPNETHFFKEYITKPGDIEHSDQYLMKDLLKIIYNRSDNEKFLTKFRGRILNMIEQGSLNDIAMVASAYFKSKTPILDCEVLCEILKRTIALISSVNPKEPVYCSIVKSVRYSRQYRCRSYVIRLTEILKHPSNRHIIFSSAFNLVHTLKLLETYRIYDEQLLSLMVQAILEDYDNYRIKDIQYAITSFSNLYYRDISVDNQLKKLLDKVVKSYLSVSPHEEKHYYYHLMPILRAFAIFNYYNEDIIKVANDAVHDPVRLDMMNSVLDFMKTSVLFFTATRLEAPEHPFGYKEMFSDEVEREYELLSRSGYPTHLSHYTKKTSVEHDEPFLTTKFMKKLAEELSSVAKKQELNYKFQFQVTLPHQNYYDLVVTKNYKSIGDFSLETFVPEKVPPNQRHCLIYLVRKFDYSSANGNSRLTGYKQLMIRLLKKLGYQIILIDSDLKPNIQSTISKIATIMNDDLRAVS